MDERNDGARLEAMFDAGHEGQYRRVEVITGPVRRRNWTDEEKARVLAESAEPDANIAAIARRFGFNRGLLNTWRLAAEQIGPASAVAAVGQPAFVPIIKLNGTLMKQMPARRRRPDRDRTRRRADDRYRQCCSRPSECGGDSSTG